MNRISLAGKYLFSIALIAFAVLHLVNATALAEAGDTTGGTAWIYISGLIMLLAGVAILVRRKDAVATVLLGFVLLMNAALIDMPNVISSGGTDILATSNFIKDLALAGAAFVYSRSASADKTDRLT